MKKTKIIATFGPSIASVEQLCLMIDCGVNIFRINCSHGKTADFVKAANLIKQAKQKRSQFPVGLLLDISGPKLRLDHFGGELEIKKGEKLTLTTGKSDLSKRTIGVNHPSIIKSVCKNERLFIDDGNLVFDIESCSTNSIKLIALNNGLILPGKGINLPDTDLKIATITDKDVKDIKTAVQVSADYIALSFVRTGNDIIEAKKIIKKAGGHQKVIAKLEKKEAIETLEEIMMLSDGVMVARGDLGVELPPEELPNLQKKIIKLANCHHKPVIVATQMLESMRFYPRATRAEINDVATAVFDHVDAVMLSAETASGNYPEEAVSTMTRVIKNAEKGLKRPEVKIDQHLLPSRIPFAIAESVTKADQIFPTSLIFAFTTSGFTAQMISNLYPSQPVIALTPDTTVMSQLTLHRSVYAVKIKQPKSFTDMLKSVNETCKRLNLAKKGDAVFITGGAPFGSTVRTNFMMIHEVGN